MLKKKFLSTIMAAAMTVSALGTSAYAYSDSGSWSFYVNPNISHTIEYINLNYYSGGYRALITSKGNGGSYNYVLVDYTAPNEQSRQVMLTETGTACQTFKAKLEGEEDKGNVHASFKATMYVEKIANSLTAYNDGEIKLSNMF